MGYTTYTGSDGTCYKHYTSTVTAWEAEISCLQDGATLVTADTAAIRTAMADLLTYVDVIYRFQCFHITNKKYLYFQ